MSAILDDALAQELDELARLDRFRSCPPLAGSSRVHPVLQGRPVLSFASNDYLGLASDPRLTTAAIAATEAHGAGSAASRLVSGDLPPHRDLEVALARHLDIPAALVFPTGYQTNLGVLTTLAGRDDLIVSDASNHASLIDGCRLSRATVRIYTHLDPVSAGAALADGSRFRRRLLVTESVFSMDGDLAPLPALAAVAASHQAALVVDEAHAIGLLGPAGRGACAAAGIRPDVLIATLGKSLGSFGGFAAGSLPLRTLLVNRARTFLFTTALPPSAPASALAALAISASPEGDLLRVRLRDRTDQLRSSLPVSFPLPASLPAAIVPLILGADARAVAASRTLLDRGIFVPAIRPPTVPEGTARLRLTLSAAHTADDVEALIAALRDLPPP